MLRAGKRLELLKQVLPRVSRVAVLMNKDNPTHAIAWKETLAAAATLHISVRPFEVQGAAAFDSAFADMVKAHAGAVVLFEDAMFATERERIVVAAARARVPTVYGQRNSVDDGGLMSYGLSIVDAYCNAAGFIDRILKGAKPADLPIEQPCKFELVTNLKTAKALGNHCSPITAAARGRGDPVVAGTAIRQSPVPPCTDRSCGRNANDRWSAVSWGDTGRDVRSPHILVAWLVRGGGK